MLANHKWKYPTLFWAWGEEEFDAADRVLRSTQLTMASEVAEFEREFAAYHGMRHAVMVNSGSSANLVAVAALIEMDIVQTGNFVTVPSLAWSTTYSPLVQHGLELVLVDCDATWNTDRPTDIIVSVLGNAHSKVGMPLLCDTCESLGARDEAGVLAGTQGLVNTFSFYASHQLSAVEGGAILTNDEDIARMCRVLLNHGWTRTTRIPQSFDEEYVFTHMGFNVRPLELHAAVARVQLRKFDARLAARSQNYDYWLKSTGDIPLTHPVIKGSPSFFGIHFQVASREIRATLAKALRAAGIDCRPPLAGSFRRQPYGARWADQKTPYADKIHDTGIMIGLPPYPAHEFIDAAVSVMREVL